jgi:hypothetical protein
MTINSTLHHNTVSIRASTYLFQFISFEENFLFIHGEFMKKYFQPRDFQICTMFIIDLFSVSTNLGHRIIQWIIVDEIRGWSWNSSGTLSVLIIYPSILLKVVLYTSMRRSTAPCYME